MAFLFLRDSHRPRRVLFVKAHIAGYTKKDGTVVVAHEDNRSPGRWGGDDRHVDEIMETIRQSPHKHHALRVMSTHPYADDDDPDVSLGQRLPVSHRWDDGKPTNRTLKGTSGIGVRTRSDVQSAIKAAGSYFGRQVVLMGGNEARRGADPGEKVISDAEVLSVWHRKREGVGRGLGIANHADHE